MPRIRTIKPEFWTSESNGRLSRDARLLFAGLISMADDEGRFRASIRGLVAAIFPFDEDAAALMEEWLRELEAEGKVRRWLHDGDTYGEVPKYHLHQKIDRPSPSKLPPFNPETQVRAVPRESSRILASPREPSRALDPGVGGGSRALEHGGPDENRGASDENQGALGEAPDNHAESLALANPRESSRALANPREPSCLDQGSGIKDQGSKALRAPLAVPPPRTPRKSKPTDSRFRATQEMLVRAFEDETGAKYLWQGAKDSEGLNRLLATGDPSDIEARWRRGLTAAGWLRVATVAQLAHKWNDLAGEIEPVKNRDWRSAVAHEHAKVGEENIF